MTSPTQMNTTKTWVQSIGELEELFRKWGVDDWVPPALVFSRREGTVTLSFALRGKWAHPTCGAYSTPEQNVRALLLTLDRVRIADTQGIGAVLAEAASVLALPDPYDPHQVLGTTPTMSHDELVQAYRAKLQETHSDHAGGSDEAVVHVLDAGRKLGLR